EPGTSRDAQSHAVGKQPRSRPVQGSGLMFRRGRRFPARYRQADYIGRLRSRARLDGGQPESPGTIGGMPDTALLHEGLESSAGNLGAAGNLHARLRIDVEGTSVIGGKE